ncbi:sulfite exporter TauE/SafE family protein [Natronoarchaeum mannanilyticum]|uniref:Probable membrane transporter protein n=1 Tax=Natronoarchaeum mannanilyticum TaxID=926360 RepID=A0AAV3T7F5_9EURY
MLPNAGLPDPTVLLIAASLSLFGVGLVKGIAGFGTGLLAVPIISKLYSPALALGVLSVTLWLVNVHVVTTSGLPRRVLATHRGHILIAVVASVLGVLGMTLLPEFVVYIGLGSYISLYLLSRNVRWTPGIGPNRPQNSLLAGGVGGFITGAFLSGGPVFVSYFQSIEISQDEFVGALGFVFTLTMMVRIAPLYATGSFGVSQTALGVGFLVPLSMGVATGDRLRPHVPRGAFDRFVELLLVAVAANLLLDGLPAVL